MAWTCTNNLRVILGPYARNTAHVMWSEVGEISGVLAYFGLEIGYFDHIFWDMDLKFVLPIIYINIKEQN